ncbi:hypothetical protein lse_0815 [Listeria seeligeri serovar 1/2b str. SLCC3954]|nr:hypothetical protein lse_0815 [Listeria seeligeri serovar 1/2b str. SLCC3954]
MASLVADINVFHKFKKLIRIFEDTLSKKARTP